MHKKTTTFPIIHTTLAALLLAGAMPVLAHEGGVDTLPEDGATLQNSPAKIGVEFDGSMRITQFEVTGPDGSVRLDDQSDSERRERYVVKPEEALSSGDYQVSWRGLSDDGHMMSDGFNFSVEP
ncbi:copper resistance CopC family protein [Vreelandella salicampi]|uniref:Copper resistance protein C n=1 Tax=Vreelandella salicampi TaxID=1449798 RepID=A0A7Z0LI09_9GAMM|nr:copper resistance CopC family protein [Halomonas salicampi]NYS59371.1 copper resistance protein CopC [Halomonas salicampi]